MSTPPANPSPDSTSSARYSVGAFVWQASIAAFLVNICQWGFVPLYPDMAADLGFGPDRFALLAAIPGMLNALLVVPVGRLTDRISPALILMIGAGSLAVGTSMRALVESLIPFTIAQIITGFGWPFFMAALVTVVLRRVTLADRTRALGAVLFAGGAGQAIGYVVIGYSGDLFGWRATSFGIALTSVLALPVLRGMRGDTGKSTKPAGGGGGTADTFRFLLRPQVAAAFAVPFLLMIINNGAIYLLPFALRDSGIDSGQSGLLLTPLIIGLLVTSALVGRFSERYGGERVAQAVFAFDAVGLFLFALVGPRVPVIIFAYFLMGSVAGAIITLSQARFVTLAERTGAVGAGVAVGCARLAQALGTAIGPGIAGVIYVRTGLSPAFSLYGTLAICAVLLAATGYGDRAKKKADPT